MLMFNKVKMDKIDRLIDMLVAKCKRKRITATAARKGATNCDD